MRHRQRERELTAIPDDNAPLPLAHRPTRWTVRRGRAIAYVLVGLAVAASLLSVYLTYRSAESSAAQAAAVDRRLSVLEDDLAERTRQRDAERDAASQEQERFRANLCVVLGELPASRGLDEIRSTLGCTQTGVTGSSSARAGVPSAVPPAGTGATSSGPSPSPTTPTTSPAPPSPASLLCGLLPLC